MSFYKLTSIIGLNESDINRSIVAIGHWKIDNAIKKGRKRGITGPMRIVYRLLDESGKGRDGIKGAWEIGEDDKVIGIRNYRG